MENTKLLTIDVSMDDIKHGKRKTTFSCPIALAVNRQLSSDKSTSIRPASSSFIYNNAVGSVIATFNLPPEATKFILDFDKGNEVKPFSFQIKITSLPVFNPIISYRTM